MPRRHEGKKTSKGTTLPVRLSVKSNRLLNEVLDRNAGLAKSELMSRFIEHLSNAPPSLVRIVAGDLFHGDVGLRTKAMIDIIDFYAVLLDLPDFRTGLKLPKHSTAP